MLSIGQKSLGFSSLVKASRGWVDIKFLSERQDTAMSQVLLQTSVVVYLKKE